MQRQKVRGILMDGDGHAALDTDFAKQREPGWMFSEHSAQCPVSLLLIIACTTARHRLATEPLQAE